MSATEDLTLPTLVDRVRLAEAITALAAWPDDSCCCPICQQRATVHGRVWPVDICTDCWGRLKDGQKTRWVLALGAAFGRGITKEFNRPRLHGR